jgi:SOS-response transcriptional repressor LexA
MENFNKLKNARKHLGWTQQKMAQEIDIGRDYLSRLENGHVEIQKWILDRVEVLMRLGSTSGTLNDGASTPHILRSEDPVPYRTSKEPPFRPIPVVSWAHAGEIDQEGNYGDLANQIDEYVSSDCRDPNSYAVIVENDSMEPELRAGDRVVLLPNTEARNGDIVVCRLAESGGTMIKRFRRTGPEGATVRLESANEIYKVQTHPYTAFRFIHPVYELHRRIRR